jgi:hypothetical protein
LIVFSAARHEAKTANMNLIYSSGRESVLLAILIRHFQNVTVISLGKVLSDDATIAVVVCNLIHAPREERYSSGQHRSK